MYISVRDNTLTLVSKGEQIIKSFYTDFNFLKAIPFNENEAIVFSKLEMEVTNLNMEMKEKIYIIII